MAAKRGRYCSFTAFHAQKHGNRPLKDVLDELRILPRDLIKDRLARIRRAGIGVIAGMIAGLDNDDPSVFERTLKFLQESMIDA